MGWSTCCVDGLVYVELLCDTGCLMLNCFVNTLIYVALFCDTG